MMGVGQALSVPTVDLSRYQTPLIGAVGTRKGMSSTLSGVLGDLRDTHLLACQWSGWREISVELTYNTISRLHIFYHLFSTYERA